MPLIALDCAAHVLKQVRASFNERYHELSSKIHDVAAAVAEVRSPLIALDCKSRRGSGRGGGAQQPLRSRRRSSMRSRRRSCMRSAAFPACTCSPRRPASPQVRSSRALKAVLETTLALGNFLNGSSAKGGAWGFKIDSLNKLIGTKTVDGSSTLLHYLARQLAPKVR